jgi:hypothetical protein
MDLISNFVQRQKMTGQLPVKNKSDQDTLNAPAPIILRCMNNPTPLFHLSCQSGGLKEK